VQCCRGADSASPTSGRRRKHLPRPAQRTSLPDLPSGCCPGPGPVCTPLGSAEYSRPRAALVPRDSLLSDNRRSADQAARLGRRGGPSGTHESPSLRTPANTPKRPQTPANDHERRQSQRSKCSCLAGRPFGPQLALFLSASDGWWTVGPGSAWQAGAEVSRPSPGRVKPEGPTALGQPRCHYSC
jgi:hypothetical protein